MMMMAGVNCQCPDKMSIQSQHDRVCPKSQTQGPLTRVFQPHLTIPDGVCIVVLRITQVSSCDLNVEL